MAELMGVCGAAPDAVRATLDRMAKHVDCSGGLRVDRWEGHGLGLLRFHHGATNPQRQPAFNRDGTLLAATDGKAFLREGTPSSLAGVRSDFQAGSNDAETVLRLYESEGEAAFKALTGSYSVLLYELESRRLLLMTDPFFSRPVFYCRLGDALLFSSRFNALLTCGPAAAGPLDMTAVMQFFTFQRVQYTSTFRRGVKAMSPASVLEFSRGKLRQRRYWRPRYVANNAGFDDLADELAETLRAAARKLTCGPQRKGLLLSGGIDSRTMAAAADAEMTAYTACDGVNPEVRTAGAVARAKGWRHVLLKRADDHYVRIIDEAVELCGGMNRYDHCHFLGLLAPVQKASDVLFGEEAMDALFKGHYWHSRLSLRGIRVPLPMTGSYSRDGIEEQILRTGPLSLFPSRPWLLFRPHWGSRYRDILYASIRQQMADARTDNPYNMAEHVAGRASLGRGLPSIRCVRPYVEYGSLSLDADLLELSARTPVRYRTWGQLLRAALKRLDGRLYAIPDAATTVRLDAPGVLAWLSQMAGEARLRALKRLGRVERTHTNESWPDRAEVLRTPAMRRALDHTLRDPAAISPDIFDVDRVAALVREHMSGRRQHMRMLLCLLTFGRWFRKYGPGDVE